MNKFLDLRAIIALVLLLVIAFGYSKLMRLNHDLELSNSAYEYQVSENAKAKAIFAGTVQANIKNSTDIIDNLNEKLALESKRAEVAEKLAGRALSDRDLIQDKYNQDVKNLSIILNEKTNACSRDDLPPDVIEWVRTLSQ